MLNLPSVPTSMTIQQAIELAQKCLIDANVFLGHGTDTMWDEAVYLTLGACDLPLASSKDVLQHELTEAQQHTWQHWLHQRTHLRVPLAYLMGYTYFADIQLKVKKGVIIPRSPIAELIVAHFKPLLTKVPSHCLDLCTGSGCIGIAIALHMQVPHVDLVDIDAQAIALAKENTSLYSLQDSVQVIVSDVFNGLDKRNQYDLIVSNPPYVDAHDFSTKPDEFAHEPALALVSGEDGLDLTARILCDASHWLTEEGWLIVEVGNSEQALQTQLPEVPFLWLAFAHGGNGVFALSAKQCRQWQPQFNAWANARLADHNDA